MNQAANASGFRIVGGRSLIGGRFADAPITLTTQGTIGEVGSRAIGRCIDATGLLVLPGLVDIHGDAFERQMMPRPGVHFSLDIALLESDRQAVSNGITTVFHGVTWSWEPGLRGSENARSLLTAIERLRSELAADTRFHLRHETYNLDAEEEIAGWLAHRRFHLLAFNDHMTAALKTDVRMVGRAGVSREKFDRVVERVHGRRDEVPHRSRASLRQRRCTAWRCSRTTTRARRSGDGIARSAAAWPSFPPPSRPRRKPPRPEMRSSLEHPTWCGAAAMSASPTRAR